MEIYRLKEAFMIFWAVLTHKNYLFASSKYADKANKCLFFTSTPAEHNSAFLESVAKVATSLNNDNHEEKI